MHHSTNLRATLSLALLLVLALPARPGFAADVPPASGGKGLHYVYLIRHGYYDRDTTSEDDRTHSALNALGHRQARIVGARLAKLPVHFRSLVSSDFLRARETAAEMAKLMHMPVQEDSLIHECTPTADRPDWMKNHTAEEIALCDSNVNAAWRKYFTPTPDADTHDVLVCHGNVIRWFVSKAISLDTTHWSRFDIGNCSITVIAVRPDGVARLVTYSDVGHIPVALQTWSGPGGGWKVPAK